MPGTDSKPDWNALWRMALEIAFDEKARCEQSPLEPMFLESGEPNYMQLDVDL